MNTNQTRRPGPEDQEARRPGPEDQEARRPGPEDQEDQDQETRARRTSRKQDFSSKSYLLFFCKKLDESYMGFVAKVT